MQVVQRRPRYPITVCKHEELTSRINNLCIAIKLHYWKMPIGENVKAWDKAKSNRSKPSLEDIVQTFKVVDVAMEGMRALDRFRRDGWLIDAHKRVRADIEGVLLSIADMDWEIVVEDLENAMRELNKDRDSPIKY